MKTIFGLFTMVVFTVLLVHAGYSQTPKMNEAYSRGVAGNLDWIEIYNPSITPLDAGGYKIYDSGGQSGTKPKKLIPIGTVVPAKGFYVVISDTADYTGDLSGFGLSSGGETVWLEDASGLLIDSLVIPALGVDTSVARVPDGASTLVKLAPVTKNSSNVSIKMNEIYSRGVAGNLDWIELYNLSNAAVDISGYKIYDSGGQSGSKPKKLIPASTSLPSKGFYIVITDTADYTGDLSGFGLSSGGETVWLEDASGLLIDTVAISALGVDTSYACVPDGSGLFVKLSPVTKGSSNEPVIPVELTSFNASSVNGNVNLEWITITETNNSGFQVERNNGNGVFEAAGFVKGNGTSAMTHSYKFVDENLNSGTYQYRLKQIDYNGTYSFSEVVAIEVLSLPKSNQLSQNYPNPFNPITSINYQVAFNGPVTLKVFDILGNEVAQLVNEFQNAGSYSIQFPANGIHLTSGTYFFELKAGDFISVKKMQLIK